MAADSPKDRFITIYGFRPVGAALADESIAVAQVLLAEGNSGPLVAEIIAAARRRGVPVHQVSAQRVKLLAGNGKHDNGVLADVVAPRMRTLSAALESTDPPRRILLLDGVRTPANVGMILRTATAAGLAGIVVPHRRTAALDPLVVKASAGVAFQAPILRCATAEAGVEMLAAAGFTIAGLASGTATSIFAETLKAPIVLVLGSETDGISPAVAAFVDTWLTIPMVNGVESLNVACAAAIAAYALHRDAR